MYMKSTLKSSLYKLVAFLTLAVALALGLMVVYFTLAKANITLLANKMVVRNEKIFTIPITFINASTTPSPRAKTPDKEPSPINLLRDMVLRDTDELPAKNTDESIETPLVGDVRSRLVSAARVFIPEGEGKQIEDTATGTVELINDLQSPQTLIATTRLLSKEDVLFRLKEKVTIPALSKIKADVYADKPGEGGNITPTEFTIPGLSVSRQKYVYANSTEPFKGGVKIVKVLAESDFKKAENELIADLNTNALKKFIKAGIPLSPSQLLVSDVEYSTDDAIGQQKLTFLMNATGTAHAVLFDIQNLEEKAKQALYDSLPKNQSILAYNSDSFVFSVLSIDASKNQADLSTSIEGFAVLQDSTGIISPMNLAGLTAQEI